MSTYIIPDIHGCIKTLRSLLECRLSITTADVIYFLGDYIDRGPDSAAVVDYIIDLQESGINVRCVKGNHEHMLMNSAQSKGDLKLWMINSGMDTSRSYGIKPKSQMDILKKLPPRHLAFFQSLKPYYIVNGRYILVHGGINYNAPSPLADTDAMLWCRNTQVPDDFMPGFTVIHGHTPAPIDCILSDVQLPLKRIINLDAGCVYRGSIPGTGYLTALNIDRWKLDFVVCID